MRKNRVQCRAATRPHPPPFGSPNRELEAPSKGSVMVRNPLRGIADEFEILAVGVAKLL